MSKYFLLIAFYWPSVVFALWNSTPVDSSDSAWRSVVQIGATADACRGTFISDTEIVTAAHCVPVSNVNIPRVYVGFYKPGGILVEPSSPKSYDFESIRVYSYFNSRDYNSYSDDIAVIKLKAPIFPSNEYRPMKIANESAIASVKLQIGLDHAGADKKRLSFVAAQFAGYDDVKRRAKIVSMSDSSQKVAGVCKGDSGSPLVVKQGDEYYLLGVVSGPAAKEFTPPQLLDLKKASRREICATSTYYTLFTKDVQNDLRSESSPDVIVVKRIPLLNEVFTVYEMNQVVKDASDKFYLEPTFYEEASEKSRVVASLDYIGWAGPIYLVPIEEKDEWIKAEVYQRLFNFDPIEVSDHSPYKPRYTGWINKKFVGNRLQPDYSPLTNR